MSAKAQETDFSSKTSQQGVLEAADSFDPLPVRKSHSPLKTAMLRDAAFGGDPINFLQLRRHHCHLSPSSFWKAVEQPSQARQTNREPTKAGSVPTSLNPSPELLVERGPGDPLDGHLIVMTDCEAYGDAL